jgi:hypothetical protein
MKNGRTIFFARRLDTISENQRVAQINLAQGDELKQLFRFAPVFEERRGGLPS